MQNTTSMMGRAARTRGTGYPGLWHPDASLAFPVQPSNPRRAHSNAPSFAALASVIRIVDVSNII